METNSLFRCCCCCCVSQIFIQLCNYLKFNANRHETHYIYNIWTDIYYDQFADRNSNLLRQLTQGMMEISNENQRLVKRAEKIDIEVFEMIMIDYDVV